jgi:DNA-binding NarL/FixJ family response regulator
VGLKAFAAKVLESLPRTWPTSSGRCRSMSGWPALLSLARTLGAQGMVLRRDKHKAAAKAVLEQALGVFERSGRCGGPRRPTTNSTGSGCVPPAPVGVSGMTAAETRVAELVAAGRTNREVAGELFQEPQDRRGAPVADLRQAGVRSRAELAHKLTRPIE